MVFKCCVPFCRGNYDNQSKATIFSFPHDQNLKEKWIKSIPRKDFEWTKNSRVCINHFKEEDIERETSGFDEKKGYLITVQLLRPRLKSGAIPSLFSGCQAYLAALEKSRPGPAEKNALREQNSVLKKKWKYLRDQFSVEFGKVSLAQEGSVQCRPKWPHYKSLLFLNGVVKPRRTPKAVSSLEENENSQRVQTDNLSVHDDENNSVTLETDEDVTVSSNQDVSVECKEENDAEKSERKPEKRKRMDESKYYESLLEKELNQEKFSEDVPKNDQSENDDFLFFRSLFPHVNRIPEHMKLRFRKRILDAVDEFAYPANTILP